MPRDHVADQKRQRAQRGAESRTDSDRQDQPADTGDAVEWRAAPNETAEQYSREEHLEDVAARLAHGGADGERHVVVREQVADQHSRPVAKTPEVQESDADTDRQPENRGHGAGALAQVTQLSACVIETCQGSHSHRVAERRAPKPLRAWPGSSFV